MAISVFDLFKIGIGPSSSHTVGPMLAANQFVRHLLDNAVLENVSQLRVQLYGSLGATGKGHGSDGAIILGLMGKLPAEINPHVIPGILEQVREQQALSLLGTQKEM